MAFSLGLARMLARALWPCHTAVATFTARKSTTMKEKNNDTERSPQMKRGARKERALEKFQTDCKSRLKLQRCARKNGNGHRFLFVGLVSRRYRNTSWINGQPFSDLTRTALFHPRVFYATFSTFLSLPASCFLILSSSFPLSSVLRPTFVFSLSPSSPMTKWTQKYVHSEVNKWIQRNFFTVGYKRISCKSKLFNTSFELPL